MRKIYPYLPLFTLIVWCFCILYFVLNPSANYKYEYLATLIALAAMSVIHFTGEMIRVRKVKRSDNQYGSKSEPDGNG